MHCIAFGVFVHHKGIQRILLCSCILSHEDFEELEGRRNRYLPRYAIYP